MRRPSRHDFSSLSTKATASVLWRAAPRGDIGGHLDAKFVTHGLVIAEEFVCHSGERRYEPGDVSVVAFDARTGHERWRVPDVELSAAAFGRIAPPGAGRPQRSR